MVMHCKALSVLLSGAAGIAAQIILLRELVVSFQGNELSIGVILATWLLLEAFGCITTGKIVHRLKNTQLVFVLTQVAMAGSLAAGIFVARAARPLMGLPPGSGLGIDAMFVISLLSLLPVALLHGSSFVWASAILGGRATSLEKTYVYETLGTMAGGAGVTFALIPVMHSYDLALVVMGLSFLSGVVLYVGCGQGSGSKRTVRTLGCIGLSVLALYPLAVGFTALHVASLQVQWEGQSLVSLTNSIYGNLAVTERAGEYTFFVDGQPVITTPFPDIARLEEFVHLTMLSHPRPQTVAVITGGAGGKINEILKHSSVASIDYVELDPALLGLISAFPTSLTEFELTHPKVRLHFDDGRYFLEQTPSFFDVCFVGITSPTDLQTNRFFTQEFFAAVKQRLNHGGIMALALPSLPRAELIIGGLADLNRTIYATARNVFPYVRVYPGDSFNLFMASSAEHLMHMNASSMAEQISSRNLVTTLLSEPYIAYRTLPWWQQNFYTSIESATPVQFNLDFRPRGVFAHMMYFSAMFTPAIVGVLDFIKAHGLMLLLAVMGVVMGVGLAFGKRGDIPVSIFTTGFVGMILDLVLIFAFQATFGYVFYWIGILVSVFMAGAACAAFVISGMLPRLQSPARVFVMIEAAITLFAIVLPGVLVVLHSHTHDLIPAVLAKALFVALSFVCGLLVGAEYPLACRLRFGQDEQHNGTTGLIYGLDLLGGWAGGVIGALFLLPLLGLVNTCLILAGVKACSTAVLAFSRVRHV